MAAHNPTYTNGFDFLEFTTTDFKKLDQQFKSMGFTPIAKHKTADITLYQQNEIKFYLNVTSNSLASQFAQEHGAAVSAMGFRTEKVELAFKHVIKNGGIANQNAQYYGPHTINGIGGSLIHLIQYPNSDQDFLKQFTMLPHDSDLSGAGLSYIDHVTHNLYRGNMNKWADFYERLFNFKEIRYFDIEGKLTGLISRAMTSPCGKIRIPLNESSDDKSQIEEFLNTFNGEGIQHIALGAADIYETVANLKSRSITFLDTPDTYYKAIEKRLPNHGESLEKLMANRILIDGNTHAKNELLLQIFTKNMLGPVFFEIIQRKGDEGFGEGNFRALFESIEQDQIQRGVLSEY